MLVGCGGRDVVITQPGPAQQPPDDAIALVGPLWCSGDGNGACFEQQARCIEISGAACAPHRAGACIEATLRLSGQRLRYCAAGFELCERWVRPDFAANYEYSDVSGCRAARMPP